MKSRISLVFIVLFAMIYQIGSTQNSIKGKVTDKITNEAMPLANVYLPEQNKGTLTDKNGVFILNNLPIGKLKIQFSYVGYKTIIKTFFTENAKTVLNIEMESTILQAEEVVVSGGTYSSQHQNAIKIELLKSKDIASTGTPTFTEAIASVPGVDMIAKGTGIAKPVIRGLSMTNILMLNNGVKMENFQFSENHPFLIDEFGIDRIEIIKGRCFITFFCLSTTEYLSIFKL